MDLDINGKMNKRLLFKTQKIYFIFSIALFIIVAMSFYVVINKLYIKEIDETLLQHKTEFIQNSIPKLKAIDIDTWNNFNTNIEISKASGIKQDTFFYASCFNQIENEKEPFRVLKSKIEIDGKPYTLSLKTSMLESEDLMISVIVLFVLIIFFLFLGLLIINRKLSQSLWKPFYKALNEIENFEIDRQSKLNFIETDIEEFNRLNKSIAVLINRNIIIYEKQREFVENAAHELQTPVAIFKAKIDTLIQRDDVSEGQAEILNSLYEAVSRLNRLNKNLLLLSKIDRKQFANQDTFSITKLIEKQLQFFEGQAEQKNINIQKDFSSDFEIQANYSLTEIFISNLLLNSIRHNSLNGNLIISIKEDKIEISNSSSNNKLLEENLFLRFSKQSKADNGNGLGLAIVKEIADINNWNISYSYKNNLHSFLVNFL